MSEAFCDRLGDVKSAKLGDKARFSVGVGLAWKTMSLEIQRYRVHDVLENRIARTHHVQRGSVANGAQIVTEFEDVSRFRNAGVLVSYAGLNLSAPQSDEFYTKNRVASRSHRKAVTIVARKLCHAIFVVMRDQRPYDSDRARSRLFVPK